MNNIRSKKYMGQANIIIFLKFHFIDEIDLGFSFDVQFIVVKLHILVTKKKLCESYNWFF